MRKLLLSSFGVIFFAGSAAGYTLVNGDVGWDGAGLGPANLSYSLAAPTLDPGVAANQKQIIESGLQQFANVVPITFTEVAAPGAPKSLDFYFSINLGPPHNFASDGVLGSLAYGFFPDDVNPNPLAGDIVFDDAENWTGFGAPGQGAGTCNAAGCDLYYVVLHEIGHALGLEHPLGESTNAPAGPLQAVMSPFFNPIGGANPGFGTFDVLQPDDIAGVRAIYGVGVGSVIPIPEPSTAVLLALGLSTLGFKRRNRV